ncbi:hypothetical protein [Microbacterium sp. LWH13-1.2]|uniref:hypothetical protein n=1 Tax=Microbacterium sp. LWH13-1.2 TaxID=3135260 RepID=UPI003138B228
MRSTGPLAAFFAATAMVVVLAGCSASAGDDSLSYDDSPLAEYVSAAYGGDLSPEEQQKQVEERQRQTEELVAQCMSDEGFEYTPIIDNGGVAVSEAVEAWEPDKREWVETYGYGVVNSPFTAQGEVLGEAYVDPNQDYIESLTETERAAFNETLYGATPTEEELVEDGGYEYDWQEAGCQGWAQHEVDGDDVWQSDEFADLRSKIEELWTQSQESPEMAELNAEWAACMADAGEPGFSAQTDASQSIVDAHDALYQAAGEEGGEQIGTESAESVDPRETPEMTALGEREIELALVDLKCRTETSYVEESLKLQFASEEKFIAANKAELDAFKAAAEQSK